MATRSRLIQSLGLLWPPIRISCSIFSSSWMIGTLFGSISTLIFPFRPRLFYQNNIKSIFMKMYMLKPKCININFLTTIPGGHVGQMLATLPAMDIWFIDLLSESLTNTSFFTINLFEVILEEWLYILCSIMFVGHIPCFCWFIHIFGRFWP